MEPAESEPADNGCNEDTAVDRELRLGSPLTLNGWDSDRAGNWNILWKARGAPVCAGGDDDTEGISKEDASGWKDKCGYYWKSLMWRVPVCSGCWNDCGDIEGVEADFVEVCRSGVGSFVDCNQLYFSGMPFDSFSEREGRGSRPLTAGAGRPVVGTCETDLSTRAKLELNNPKCIYYQNIAKAEKP